METAKSAMIRPITSRPLSSARAMISTGLIAPKSSRGRTGLRRQIQDKSYFVGLLKSKITEINNEKNVLLRECEIMSKEEARIGVYRQKAEVLAKDLDEYTLDLMAYNEFLDRIRIGDDVIAIKNDTNQIKHENDALIVNLENDYSRLREHENTIKKNDSELQEVVKSINSVKNRFTDVQRTEFNGLQIVNEDLTKECHKLENEIAMWRSKKTSLEEKIVKEDNLVKLELLQSLSKLKQLEKQKNELLYADDSEENEREHLLAQVKRDNTYIASMENKMEQLNKMLSEIKSEIDFYKDGGKMVKFADLKQKEVNFEELMSKYDQEKNDCLNQIESINNEINDVTTKLTRYLKYINTVKELSDESNPGYSILNELVIQKRKLELDLYKNKQIKLKTDNEKEALSAKIAKLKENIESYSNVAELKSQIESKLNDVNQKVKKIKQEIEQIKLENEGMNSDIREVKLELEKSKTFLEISKLEDELRVVLKVNEELKANDSSEMLSEIKNTVLENIKKYNQNLMGF